ncbi:MAG: toprim domain-containing protein, partial [Alphaproteobacteria bacterium]|nr:toprim domain-containing protein [Alphaproteobacteria bacterium]
MNPEEAKESAKTHLLDYLNAKGINTSTNFSCLNPSHDDKHPSMSFDTRRNRCHCFSCGVDYDIFDIVALDTGLSGKELFNHVYKMYNISVDYSNLNANKAELQNIPHSESNTNILINKKPQQEQRESLLNFFDVCHAAVEKTDYWKKRGLSKAIVDAYNLGYWEEKKRFVIPTGEFSYNARATWDADKKARYLKPKGQFELFNLKAIQLAEQPVFVVEGEFDALSVIEAGGVAVALGSSSNFKFIDYVKSNKPKYPLILALDNDDAGRVGEEKLAEELAKIGVECVEADITDNFKDANEALVNDRETFIQNVLNAKNNVIALLEEKKQKEEAAYYQTSAANGLAEFINEIQKRRDGDCISTGFKNLDEILDGGFYPGLYIIGAISSLGKTTFSLQIADNAAKNGQDVLVFSLEMGKQELVAKSISRLSFLKCKNWGAEYDFATTTRNLLNAKALANKEKIEFLNECLKEYASYAGKIYYHIGIGDIGVEQIKSVIARHIKITGRKPLVIIDYLQIIAPFDMRATDKQNTDKAVVELKRASRDYDVPIFAISSFNRENYTSPVNIASFKESGAIEYTSDVLMALQFKGMDYLKKEDGKYEDEKTRTARIIQLRNEQEKNAEIPGKPQELQLKILKNRNGRKGGVDFEFHPMFNCFEVPKPKVENGGWT